MAGLFEDIYPLWVKPGKLFLRNNSNTSNQDPIITSNLNIKIKMSSNNEKY